MEKGKEIKALMGIELTSLLRWHSVAKYGDGKKGEMWVKILEEGKDAPSFKDSSVKEEAGLAKL